jgi:hypothetical protein
VAGLGEFVIYLSIFRGDACLWDLDAVQWFVRDGDWSGEADGAGHCRQRTESSVQYRTGSKDVAMALDVRDACV